MHLSFLEFLCMLFTCATDSIGIFLCFRGFKLQEARLFAQDLQTLGTSQLRSINNSNKKCDKMRTSNILTATLLDQLNPLQLPSSSFRLDSRNTNINLRQPV